MSVLNRAELFSKLNAPCYQALQAATAFCKLRGHAYVEMVHWIHQLLENPQADWALLLQEQGVDRGELQRDILRALDALPRGASAISDLSIYVDQWVESAWVYSSLTLGEPVIRGASLLICALSHPALQQQLRGISTQFGTLNAESLAAVAVHGLSSSIEQQASSLLSSQAPATTGGALAQYCDNLTARAQAGELDPVVGREDEIRRLCDVLLRRRQNNPLLTGEAGVGKTAVVEGLAQRLALGQVPAALQDVQLYRLDLGLLQAGASMKGEFEQRLVSLLEEVAQSPVPIVLFIDEIHTLVGAGNTPGAADAANLLKPALARGQFRTIGATTWREYKKYIEPDPALTRRFELVQVAEPSVEQAQNMLRGVARHLAAHHQVLILDEAIASAVKLSHRYMATRQLPDKAVALLDTACARVAISQHSPPAQLEHSQRQRDYLASELELLLAEQRIGRANESRLQTVGDQLIQAEQQCEQWQQRWEQERHLIQQIIACQQRLLSMSLEDMGREELEGELQALLQAVECLCAQQPLVFSVVDTAVVASIVAEWTGIPVGSMQSDELDQISELAQTLGQRVIQQDYALAQIAQRIQSSRARLLDPEKPIGVFLLCGPSGVGKTETALALAERLYGGEHNIILINMSEFQEAHSVSGLKGSPPGYVGYGEGGRLTEAVRRRPHSVVLLDEIEKAHPDVHELFFQVFDKGWMEDGEGQRIDFRHTVILLTSNVGTELFHELAQSPERPAGDEVVEWLRPSLLSVFPPALLGRMTVLPYFALDRSGLEQVARLRWAALAARVKAQYELELVLEDSALSLLLQYCKYQESGARLIETMLQRYILPPLTEYLLARNLQHTEHTHIVVSARQGEFYWDFVNHAEMEAPLSGGELSCH
ncbi:type VI secretion system ATPase TssH [Alcaligenes endophyticus]|uniref:Type VI secretion system ATPase TssH n=1 Tax=Alcaligenes endophyticus TaxID=1929088 RepID=A0ABT8EKR5_9BURK|nr:type VI secretion system ATPase TssH [Alcaligenes endophyticus]MCX5590759.1 type VI secretion system ATPase TssH [Alcaligenes endophyticus]MDN4121878.1 type VI secretion system ATPase TssH [Alcaligenes endophyticus]